MEDSDKFAVYYSQDLFLRCLDRARLIGTVTLDGQEFQPEMEPRFSAPADVERYVHRVMTHLQDGGCDYGGRERMVPGVRARRGRAQAHYEPLTQTIAVPTYEVGGAWALRGMVVLHEVAHHLAPDDGHGMEFRTTFVRLLEDLGAPESARLLVTTFAAAGLSMVPADVADDVLARMGQILRQAENTPYESERELFMGRAQELATRHQVALAVLRSRNDSAEREGAPRGETLVIGKRGAKGLNRLVILLSHIRQVNNLEMTISHDSTRVVLFGFAADIAVARALFASLTVQMAAAWAQYFAEHPTETDPWARRREVPTITRRLEFNTAFVESVGERLAEARERALAQGASAEAGEATTRPEDGAPAPVCGDSTGEAVAGGVGVPDIAVAGQSAPAGEARETGAALALRARALEVSEAFKEHMRLNNVRGTWRGGRAVSGRLVQAPGSARAGRAAGKRAPLGGQRALPGV